MAGRPAAPRRAMSSTLVSVLTICFSFCRPSRGPSRRCGLGWVGSWRLPSGRGRIEQAEGLLHFSRIWNFWILPVTVIGKLSTKLM
jgi:hypothetical protein